MKVNSLEEAKKAEVGDKLKIRLASNQEIPAEIEYIKEDEEIILKVAFEGEKEGLENFKNTLKDILKMDVYKLNKKSHIIIIKI